MREENHSQFTACSGKSPVCLKLKGFRRKVRLSLERLTPEGFSRREVPRKA